MKKEYTYKKMNIPLSGQDILTVLHKFGKYPKIIEYNNLRNLTVNDLLNNSYVILYNSSATYGHWVLLFPLEKNRREIEFFDSYGLFPDDEMKYTRYINDPVLDRLLMKAMNNGIHIEYNNYPLQDINDMNIKTCGKHVLNRLIFDDLSIDKYKQLLDSFLDSDIPNSLTYDNIIEYFYNIEKNV